MVNALLSTVIQMYVQQMQNMTNWLRRFYRNFICRFVESNYIRLVARALQRWPQSFRAKSAANRSSLCKIKSGKKNINRNHE